MPDNGDPENGGDDVIEERPTEEGPSADDVIPRSVLPEELRDLPPEQIGGATQALVATLESRNQEIERYQERLARGPGGREEVPEEPDLPDLSDDEFRDMILENPEEALEYYLQKKGYAAKLRQIEEMATEGVHTGAFTRARQELPDFGQYEDGVQKILDDGGAVPTYGNIRGAYLMARGVASLEEAKKKSSKKVTSEPPSPPEPEKDEPELSAGEERARKALGMSREDYIRGRDTRVEVTPPGLED